MASGNPFFDDLRSKPEVIDPPQNEDIMDSEFVNDPTQTATKPNVTVSSSVRELLECPVCLNAMYPPIHQCLNGHTLCSGCKPRVHNRCPTCRHELGNIRCLALEKVAASLELPCKYQSFGCSGIYPYYSKLKHESQCSCRPYSCPYAGSECAVIGDIPYLVAHLKDDHKVDMHNGSTFNHRYVKSNPHEVENATWMLTVLLLYSWSIFLVIFWFLFNPLEEEFVVCLLIWFIWIENPTKSISIWLSYCSTIESNHRGDLKLSKWLCCMKLKTATRFSVALVSTFACILKRSSLEWLLFI
ncbi:E3 ubiquitin-protein ligase SINAT5-like isoform X2 [Durio zibethinus]|uniref:RING-type E3 ubiquitin transferase n=1 Tax=Durio zibethinus TaxID=66656 RepID=A0A6P5YWB2_DURZI|nr:E3 ubiquitin-protein ligase SINAT5-like isoform X2 [Durio zibethinus]